MFEFEIPWNDVADTVTNLSFLNSPILDQNGFVGIENGHFSYNGARIRFFGGSLSYGANFPDNDTAEIIAGRLAKLGCNLVRLCHMVCVFSDQPQGGIWEPGHQGAKRYLDPGQLKKLDYLLNEFKQRGIFVDLGLHVSRELTEDDGIVKDENMPDFNKGVDIFDATMRTLHKEYASDLLNHVNQYTELAYYNDPVIAMVEVTNEDSLLVVWQKGGIDPLVTYYQEELGDLWEDWWTEKYPEETRPPRPTRDEVRDEECSEETAERYIDFLLTLEEEYHQDMKKHLENVAAEGVGVQVPISGTQSGTLDATKSSTFRDNHCCWDCWSSDGYFTMDSIVEDPFRNDRNVIPYLSGAKVSSKPYVATEVSSPAPNYGAAEPILLTALYGAFQDWDGMLPYAYKHYTEWNRDWFGDMPNGGSKYDFDRHMTKMVAITVASLLFRRFDINKGGNPVQVVTTRQDVLEEAWGRPQMAFSMVTHALGSPGRTGYLPQYATLMRRVEIDKGETHIPPQVPPEPDPPIYVTDTGELEWREPDEDQGVVKVDADNIQALIGYIEAPEVPYEFEHGLLDGGSIEVISIESTAIIAVILKESTPESKTYLIIATGEIENTNLAYELVNSMYRLVDWGSDPILVEGIEAYITLLVQEENIEWYALDPEGNRVGDQLPKDDLGTGCGLALSEDHRTLWYELVVAQVG